MHASWQETKQKLEQLQQEQMALSTVVSQHDASLEKYRLEIRQMEEQLEKEQQALLEISGEAEKSDGQGEVLKERRRNLEISRSRMRTSFKPCKAASTRDGKRSKLCWRSGSWKSRNS